jgi:hypothetical protein
VLPSRPPRPQRVEGVDAGELQRRFLQIGALKGLDMKMEDLVRDEPALLIHLEGVGGYFQQGIGLGIESGGFNIDDDGVKAAKTALEGVNGVGHGISVGVKGGGIMAKKRALVPYLPPWDGKRTILKHLCL